MTPEALADFRAMYHDHAPSPWMLDDGGHIANCERLLDHIDDLTERLADKPPPVDVALQSLANRHLAADNQRLQSALGEAMALNDNQRRTIAAMVAGE